MITRIEQFKYSDYKMIKSWWDFYKEQAPQENLIPDTTYIMFSDNKPILSVSLIMTNIPLAWVDNFIGNPEFKGPIRKECGSILLDYISNIAKQYGKEKLFCMSMNEKTAKRYLELGFTQTASNINTFLKGVN